MNKQQIFMLLMILGLLPMAAVTAEPLVLSDKVDQYPLGLKVDLLEDKEGSVTLLQVLSADMADQFTRSKQQTPNFAFTQSVYWAKLTLKNPSSQSQQWLLELAYPHLDNIEVYFVRADGSHNAFHTGDTYRFAQRPIQHINFVFPFSIAPHQSLTMLVRVRSSTALQFPLTLFSPTAFNEQSNKAALGFGLYYGIMLVMALYNLFIFVLVRDRSYLYYVLNIGFFSLSLLAINGLAYQHLWPQSPWFANRVISFSMAFTGLWTLLFSQHFLQLKINSPRLNRLYPWFQAVTLALILCSLIAPPAVSMQLGIVLALCIILLVLLSGIQSIRNGYRPAWFFVLAWAGVLLGVPLRFLLAKGVLEGGFVIEYSIQIGSALEVILLSLALADRIKLLQQKLNEKDKLAKDNALKAQLNAEKSNQAKSTFIANVSHEIRTPLNAVLGYTQILEREPGLAPQYKQKIEIIDRSGHHLLELINDILDISKMEANAMALHEVDFELVDLVDGIAVMFSARCEEKQLKWRFDNQVGKHITVHGDLDKLRQILINLLGNAVKFTTRGEIVLTLSNELPGYYRFEVSDTGEGIPIEQYHEIFKPFGQAAEGSKHGGTGLGLAIASQQVGLMGDNLQFDSKVGQGSRFFFTLPFASAKADVDVRHSRQVKAIRLAPGVQVSALVVDDIKENREILIHMLEDVGITTCEAENGLAALNVLHAQSNNLPDLVFIDIRMPIMDGIKALELIQRDFKGRCPTCVVVTAHAMQSDIEHYLHQGFDHYIAKPFRFEAVYECIHHLLHVDFRYHSEPCRSPQNASPQANTFCIPEALYESLHLAASEYEVSKIEACLVELASFGDPAEQLAGQLRPFLANYDMAGLLDKLVTMNRQLPDQC